MLRRGLTAAGLVIAAVVLVAGGRAEPAQSHAAHTCGALDRQFIKAAGLSSAAVEVLGQDLVAGDVEPADAIAQAKDAALGLEVTKPRDRSLELVRVLMRGMITEYEKAIHAQWKGKGNAGEHMYRSYSFANYAHQVLVQAQGPLEAKGCSLADLL